MKSDTAKGLLKTVITMTAFLFILVTDCIKELSNLSIFQVLIIFNGLQESCNLICTGTNCKVWCDIPKKEIKALSTCCV